MVLYFKYVVTVLTWSAESMQRLHINRNARRIGKSASYLESFSKDFWLQLAQRSKILVSYLVFYIEQLWFLIVVALIPGWTVGLWAIAVKTSLPGDLKVVVGVGFGLGIPFVVCLWASILLNEREERLRRPALVTFPCLLLGLGIGIWAVLTHSPLSYDEKVRVAVGMGVGGPCVFLLWILTLRHFGNLGPLSTVLFLILLIPSLWAMAVKTPWDRHVRVSVCLGVGFGLPCLVMILTLLLEA